MLWPRPALHPSCGFELEPRKQNRPEAEHRLLSVLWHGRKAPFLSAALVTTAAMPAFLVPPKLCLRGCCAERRCFVERSPRQMLWEDVADEGSSAGVQWETLTPIQLPGLMWMFCLKVKFPSQGPAVIIRNST